MNKKELSINIAANISVFALTWVINFFLLPYIVENVGPDAYGFVVLSNDLVSYVSLASIALNSMAARFISVNVYRGDMEEAKYYFSSVKIANIILSVILLLPCLFIILFLNELVGGIPSEILFEVRLLFAFALLNFLISLITSAYSIAVFVRNKLYLSSFVSIQTTILKCVLLLALFYIFGAKIYFLSLAGVVLTLYAAFFHARYTKRLLPGFRTRLKYFDFKKVLKLFSAGLWNVIVKLGSILLGSVDLLITNLLIGSAAMGVYAIAKTPPTAMAALTSSIGETFSPTLTKEYANNDYPAMFSILRNSFKIMTVIACVPSAALIVLGESLYKLWTPTQDARLLSILSVLCILNACIYGSLTTLYSVFTAVNKLKANCIAILINGIANLILVFILIKTTNLGLYAVAGVSEMTTILRNTFFTLPLSAKYIKQKWYVFYIDALRAAAVLGMNILIFITALYIFSPQSWLSFIATGVTGSISAFTANIFIVLSRGQRKNLAAAIKARLERGKS